MGETAQSTIRQNYYDRLLERPSQLGMPHTLKGSKPETEAEPF